MSWQKRQHPVERFETSTRRLSVLQVSVSGVFEDSRYIVACNGRRVPLQPASEPGVAVAGVRFRARKLSATMHPTIPVHSPLTFTLIDRRTGRSLAQCAYRVDPPDGREYTGRPGNADEALARRLERFEVISPVVQVTMPVEEINPTFPATLDLRIPAASPSARVDNAGVFAMTVDLYQTPLRYGEAYDELSDDGVNPRAHWAHLIESLRAIGPEELGRRCLRAERRIRENGITYNIYSDPLGANRPWEIDIVPFLIAADEWRYIEQGIIQRAQLLSLILEDIYGSQSLIKDGHFPAELLYANPAFLRPMVGVRVPSHSYLHMLAVDLARSPDGQWWVLSDRTQAPSGSGYALENRTIVSDVLPSVFSSSNVLRLAPFFRAQRDALASLTERSNPRIVLLTPGPHNETYFEHSYIARYLGFALVEGVDLTVRDRCVFLKTVDGLERVDVILRRVDDSFCDPLELRSDSLLGVPGLVDAVVAGNVQVANALGSGVIETAAIMPFLPGLSRHLTGENLKLPSVATWWCGQSYAFDWVINHLDSVVLKPAFPSRGMEPVFAAKLEPAEKRKLTEQMRALPHEYVAQEQIALSNAPVWGNGHLYSRSAVLRAYVVNTGHGWTAIPGGLVRVADAEGSVVSMQRGGHSKDAWVLWDSPGGHLQLAPSAEPAGCIASRITRRAKQRSRQSILAGKIRRAGRKHRANRTFHDFSRPSSRTGRTRVPGPLARLLAIKAQQVAQGKKETCNPA